MDLIFRQLIEDVNMQAALAKGSSMWSRTDDKMGKEEEHEYMQIQIIKRRI